uniref:Uncharacterized protein n=1 Tax=Parascaris univalens TaxID=6257 RepID=A0A914ZSE8_PARUN
MHATCPLGPFFPWTVFGTVCSMPFSPLKHLVPIPRLPLGVSSFALGSLSFLIVIGAAEAVSPFLLHVDCNEPR